MTPLFGCSVRQLTSFTPKQTRSFCLPTGATAGLDSGEWAERGGQCECRAFLPEAPTRAPTTAYDHTSQLGSFTAQETFGNVQRHWTSLVAQMVTQTASLVTQTVKNPPAMWETWVWSHGWEDPPEKSMATHSSVFARRIPIDRGAWWATVHGVTKSQTWLSD